MSDDVLTVSVKIAPTELANRELADWVSANGGGGCALVVNRGVVGAGGDVEFLLEALLMTGVRAVLAVRVEPWFARGCLERGVAALALGGDAAGIGSDDELAIDLAQGEARNVATGRSHRFPAWPRFLRFALEEAVAAAALARTADG